MEAKERLEFHKKNLSTSGIVTTEILNKTLLLFVSYCDLILFFR